MTRKEREKLEKTSEGFGSGQPLDMKKDKKCIQKIFRSEVAKYLDKKGVYTEKKDWSLRFRSGSSAKNQTTLELSTEYGKKRYTMRTPGEEVLEAWVCGDKSLLGTLKDSDSRAFALVLDGNEVVYPEVHSMTFKDVLKDVREFLENKAMENGCLGFTTGPEEEEEYDDVR